MINANLYIAIRDEVSYPVELFPDDSLDDIIIVIKRADIWNGELLSKSKKDTNYGFDVWVNDTRIEFRKADKVDINAEDN